MMFFVMAISLACWPWKELERNLEMLPNNIVKEEWAEEVFLTWTKDVNNLTVTTETHSLGEKSWDIDLESKRDTLLEQIKMNFTSPGLKAETIELAQIKFHLIGWDENLYIGSSYI